MKDRDRSYKHFIPKLELSIERNTVNVPNDGRFYVVKAGKVLQNFRSRKLAEEKFRELVKESGFKPEEQPTEKMNPIDEAAERYAMAKDIFWAEGPKYRGKGGRGGRGGV